MSQNKEHKVLLVIEDDLGLQKQLKWCFEQYRLVFAVDEASAIKQLRRYEPEVVTLDLGLPPDPANASVGLGVLEKILQLAPQTKIIVVTGNDDQSNAVRAIAMGAYDFYQKPMDPEVMTLIIERAFKLSLKRTCNKKKTEQKPKCQAQFQPPPLCRSTSPVLKCRNYADVTVVIAPPTRYAHGLAKGAPTAWM